MATVILSFDKFCVQLTPAHRPFFIDSDGIVEQHDEIRNMDDAKKWPYTPIDQKDSAKLEKLFDQLHSLMLRIEDKYARQCD